MSLNPLKLYNKLGHFEVHTMLRGIEFLAPAAEGVEYLLGKAAGEFVKGCLLISFVVVCMFGWVGGAFLMLMAFGGSGADDIAPIMGTVGFVIFASTFPAFTMIMNHPYDPEL